MPQLAREAQRIKAICVSLEWCAIDKTALWQFVNDGALFCARGLSAFSLHASVWGNKPLKLSTHHTRAKTTPTPAETCSARSTSLLQSACQGFVFFPFVPAVCRILPNGCSIPSHGEKRLDRPAESLISPYLKAKSRNRNNRVAVPWLELLHATFFLFLSFFSSNCFFCLTKQSQKLLLFIMP